MSAKVDADGGGPHLSQSVAVTPTDAVRPAAETAATTSSSAVVLAEVHAQQTPAPPPPADASAAATSENAVPSADGQEHAAEDFTMRVPIEVFSSKKIEDVRAIPASPQSTRNRKQLKKFYESQNDLIGRFEQVNAQLKGDATEDEEDDDNRPMVKLAINLSFAVNIVLFCIKIAAAIYSGSLAVIASAVDSSLDLLSGSIIFVATKIAARKNKFKWPVGKSRLEPLSIVIFASVMGVAALQLVIQGIQKIVEGITTGPEAIKVDAVAYGVIAAVIVAKACLFVLCFAIRKSSSSASALAQDHRNDVISNTVTLVVLILLGKYPSVWWLDPATAMAVGIFIMVTWTLTGKGHVQQLTGRVADAQQLSVLTLLAMNHDKRVQFVDTVRAYYVGAKVLAEVDIVLPSTMPLTVAHDIAESLQRKIEQQDFVERAFVHIDTEFDHKERDEHTVAWK